MLMRLIGIVGPANGFAIYRRARELSDSTSPIRDLLSRRSLIKGTAVAGAAGLNVAFGASAAFGTVDGESRPSDVMSGFTSDAAVQRLIEFAAQLGLVADAAGSPVAPIPEVEREGSRAFAVTLLLLDQGGNVGGFISGVTSEGGVQRLQMGHKHHETSRLDFFSVIDGEVAQDNVTVWSSSDTSRVAETLEGQFIMEVDEAAFEELLDSDTLTQQGALAAYGNGRTVAPAWTMSCSDCRYWVGAICSVGCSLGGALVVALLCGPAAPVCIAIATAAYAIACYGTGPISVDARCKAYC
ncbi:hypothetical protein [Ruania zhangjianzhongii]|nr:hypothetical protein [Ruania zhangjianzhongii]